MIHHIYIEDYDERHAPPTENVLCIGLVSDTVHMTLGKYDETSGSHSFEDVTTFGCSVMDLMNAIKILALSQDREDLAKLLPRGDIDLRPVNV